MISILLLKKQPLEIEILTNKVKFCTEIYLILSFY